MRHRGHWRLLLGFVCLHWLSCTNQNRIVVYTDPWLLEYADSLCAVFQRDHPDTEIRLKSISSEVIVQHVCFGQPVDVFLCFGSEWYSQPGFRERVALETTLAPSMVVDLICIDSAFAAKQRRFGTRNVAVIEASDRPLRRYTDQMMGDTPKLQDSILIANFQRQAVDYLLRGWVAKGYMPLHFARKHASRFAVQERGPLISKAFTAILLRDAPQPTLAKQFFELTQSEKSREILGKLRFLP